jgi:23S rRNA pseudouridine2605 synthase
MSGGAEREKQDGGGSSPKGERIAKVIARAGVCSRRDAEKLVADGRVTLNGRVLDSPAVTVGPKDRIEVNGQLLDTRERTRLWLFHKPKGLVPPTATPKAVRPSSQPCPPTCPGC